MTYPKMTICKLPFLIIPTFSCTTGPYPLQLNICRLFSHLQRERSKVKNPLPDHKPFSPHPWTLERPQRMRADSSLCQDSRFLRLGKWTLHVITHQRNKQGMDVWSSCQARVSQSYERYNARRCARQKTCQDRLPECESDGHGITRFVRLFGVAVFSRTRCENQLFLEDWSMEWPFFHQFLS